MLYMQNQVCEVTELLEAVEYFLCNLPFNCLILASTLAVNPILVDCRALFLSFRHI